MFRLVPVSGPFSLADAAAAGAGSRSGSTRENGYEYSHSPEYVLVGPPPPLPLPLPPQPQPPPPPQQRALDLLNGALWALSPAASPAATAANNHNQSDSQSQSRVPYAQTQAQAQAASAFLSARELPVAGVAFVRADATQPARIAVHNYNAANNCSNSSSRSDWRVAAAAATSRPAAVAQQFSTYCVRI